MTLTDFLLARIAEDEANLRNFAGVTEDDFIDDSATTRWGDRVLAECGAKRRIVEDFQHLDADYRETRSRETEARRFQALVSIGQLATAYADHPDYDETWRP